MIYRFSFWAITAIIFYFLVSYFIYEIPNKYDRTILGTLLIMFYCITLFWVLSSFAYGKDMLKIKKDISEEELFSLLPGLKEEGNLRFVGFLLILNAVGFSIFLFLVTVFNGGVWV